MEKIRDAQDVMRRPLDDWAAELDADMATDKFALDDGCARQSGLYSKWAYLSAKASEERDWRQKELDERNAQLDNEVRSDPGRFGLGDIKENAVKAVIASDEGIMRLKADVIRATAYAKFFNSAVGACDQKKTMLRMLGDLWLGEYYSETQVRKGEVEDRLRSKMRERRPAGGGGRGK